ncbi:hypothetical protein C5167_050875 [Papaver somniferum]|uniref:Uncharacterized protein n=1 Tax=Papaver somniferum TaxID=3469 RepID=A0A4Y7KPX9_PAPSO|nr:hypothetical protein C5167_050875 [Papaver somniferum]
MIMVAMIRHLNQMFKGSSFLINEFFLRIRFSEYKTSSWQFNGWHQGIERPSSLNFQSQLNLVVVKNRRASASIMSSFFVASDVVPSSSAGEDRIVQPAMFTFELLRDSTLILQLIDMDVVSCKNVSLSLQVLLSITDSELGLLDKVEDVEYEKSTVNAYL